jgi:hypothetical protein
LIGQLLNKKYFYELILCGSLRNEIGTLEYTDLTFSPRFDSFNELNFELSYYQNGWTRIKDENFDLTKGLLLVLMNIKEDDTIIYSEYFVINQPTKSSNNTIKKSIDCIAYAEYIFNNKRLRGYKDTRKLYDFVNPYDFNDNTKGGILNLLLTNYLYDSWSIGYINPNLNIYHSFDFSDSSYTDVFKSLEKEYNCFIVFDSINKEINIYEKSELGEQTNLVLSDTNFIKSISNENKFDQLITRLTITGKDNVGIYKYNITGRDYVENFDWFIDNDYFSGSLKSAWNNYKTLLATKDGDFTSYINQLDSYETNKLLKQNELVALNSEKAQIEDALDLEKNTYSSNTSAYDSIFDDLQDKEIEIENKEDEISAIQANINTVNANILILRNTLSYENNFTQAQLEELIDFVKEQSISFDQVSDAKQLYEYAKQYIIKVSQTPITFDLDSIDIFSCKEGEVNRANINIGSFISIDSPELGFNYYPIRLVAYSHNPISNSLSMSFSNTDKLENDLALLGKNIFKLTTDVANQIEVKKYDYSKYVDDRDRVVYTDSIIENTIKAGSNYISQRGFIGSDISGTGSIQLKNDKIIFSEDSWETYYTLLSANGLYMETSDKTSRVAITRGNGIQIDIFNEELNNFRNAIYLGLDSLNKPCLYIDNGFIKMTTIIDAVERYKIDMSPELGFYIRANTGTQEAQVWEDRIVLDSGGNLIAKKLRTSSIVNDYIVLEEQNIKFWNDGLEKMSFGFEELGGFTVPYCIFGAGDGSAMNVGAIYKSGVSFSFVHFASNGSTNAIHLVNSGEYGYTNGAVLFDGLVDFSGATIKDTADGIYEITTGTIITVSNGLITDVLIP